MRPGDRRQETGDRRSRKASSRPASRRLCVPLLGLAVLAVAATGDWTLSAGALSTVETVTALEPALARVAELPRMRSILVSVDGELLAEIDLVFSHIDNNLSGLVFPEENFVFTEGFKSLLRDYNVQRNKA